MLYYLYTVKLRLDEDGFFKSSLSRVIYLIEKWTEEERMKAAAASGQKLAGPPQAARSIKEVLSHYGKK